MPTQVTEYADSKLVPTENLHLYVLVSLIQEGTLHTIKRNINPLSTMVYYLQDILGQWWCKAYENNQQTTDLRPLHKIETIPDIG